MAQYLNLPNGYSVEIKEGETREAALARAISKYPDIFGFGQAAVAAAQQPESGFVPALKSGVSSLKSDIAALAGRTGIMDQAAAEKYIKEQEEYQKRTFKPTETFGEAPITKTLELLGGSVPYMAAPIAAGAIAPAGALALGAAGAASAAQFTGSNLSRQMQEGKTLGETDVTAAALASVPQAALDALSLKMLPGIRRIFGQAGKEISNDAARAIAQQSVKEVAKDYALATGKAMGTEGLTEVGQQALERMQAGLALTDEKAREEYFDSLVGGAVLGGVLSPAGRYVERRGQAKKEEEAGLEAALKQREADAKQRELKLAQQATPEGRLAFVQDYEARQARFQELKDMAKPGKGATPLQQAEYAELSKEKSALGKSLFQDSAEYKKALPIVQQFKEQQRVAAMTPEDFFLEQSGMQVQPIAPVPTKTVIDEFGQIKEVPVDAQEQPEITPAAQYLTQQLQGARDMGVMDLGELADFAMQNPELARQAVTERAKVDFLSTADNRNLLDGIKLRLKEVEKQRAAGMRDEMAQRAADIKAQAPTVEMPDTTRQDLGEFYQQKVEEGQGYLEPTFEYLDPIFEQAFNQPPTIKISDKVQPIKNAPAMRERIESLMQQADQADKDYRTARAARQPDAAVAAKNRGVTAVQEIDSLSQEGNEYSKEFLAARRQQNEALAGLQDVVDQLRTGQTLGGPNKAMAASTEETLTNQAERLRAQLITNALQEAALHRRAAGEAQVTQDEAIKAASRLYDTVEAMLTRAKTEPEQAEYEEVIVQPAQMRGTQIVKPAVTERRKIQPQAAELSEQAAAKKAEERAAAEQLQRVEQQIKEVKSDITSLREERAASKSQEAQARLDALIAKQQNQLGPLSLRETEARDELERIKSATAPTKQAPTVFGDFEKRIDSVRRQLFEPPNVQAGRVEPELKTQFAETEAKKVAEARGETAETLGGQLRRRTEFVRDKMTKMGAMRPMARDVLNKAADVMDAGQASQALLDAVEPVVDAITSKRQLTQTDLRAISDALKAAEPTAAEQQAQGQQSLNLLFEEPGQRPRLVQKDIGFIRSSFKNFENSPAVKKAKQAIAQATQLAKQLEAKRVQEEKDRAETAKKVAKAQQRRILDLEGTVRQQRNDLQQAVYDAIEAEKAALADAQKLAAAPQLKAAEQALAEAEEALKKFETRLETLTENIEFPWMERVKKEKASVRGRIGYQQTVVQNAKNELAQAVANSQVQYDNAAVVARANQDSLVQFERKALEKFEQRLEKLREQATAPSAELAAAQNAADEQRALVATSEKKARDAAEKADKAKRDLEQRWLSGLGLPGVKRAAGETVEIETAERKQLRKELDEAKTRFNEAQDALEGVKVEAPQVPKATGPVMRGVRTKVRKLTQERTPKSPEVETAVAEANVVSAERAAQEPAKTPVETAKEAALRQQQMREGKERLENSIRTQLADINIRIDALKRAVKPNPDLIKDLEQQRQSLQRDLVAARKDVEKEGELEKATQRELKKEERAQAKREAEDVSPQAVRPPAFKTRVYSDGRTETVTREEALKDAERKRSTAPPASPGAALARQYKTGLDESAEFNGMTFAQAARHGAKKTTSPMVRQLFERLAVVFEQAPADQQGVVYAADGPLTMSDGKLAAGIFANRINTILTVAPSVRAGANKTLLHELVHAATVRGLMVDKDLDARVTDLRERVKAWLETPDGRAYFRKHSMELQAKNRQEIYGLTNNKEFLAELFADRGFQKMLSVIPSGKPRTSIFTRFVQALVKYFDMPGQAAQSAFAEAVALTEEVFNTTVQQVYKTPNIAELAAGESDISPLILREPKYASPEWNDASEDIRKVVAQQRTWGDKIKANATGLAFETQLVDRFAAFERLRKYMPEQMGTQMMYYLRMYDQRMNFVSQAVSNGALRLAEKTRPDGKTEYLIESKEGANIGNVVQILRGAQPFIGNAEAVNQAFTTYLAALRADRVGLDKLNFGGSVTQDMLDRTMRLVNGNDKLKDVFEKARREYNTYNRDQIAMVAATGAISKETEAALTRSDDYIPFYRAQNGVVELLIGGEAPMRIGSIADQPYLQELVGGDQPILDFMTSSVQNTNMLVDMALRNLATKNAVFELINLGAAKIVKGKPQGRDVVQFKVDGQDRYAVISSETVTVGGKTFETGVPADILVKGMEGIPTQMPFLFRAMAMPAQLLRKAVTLSPLYMAKQLFRDSLSAPIISGANFTPVLGALRQIGKPSGKTLEERGVTGGQYMTGTTEDITKILRDISEGGPGWMSALSKVEAIGMKADALTRRAQYNSYIEQGMSEMEATLMALESMNFNKRGASPSIHVANALIPFFNAQIQGLNVLYKAMSGQMPFSDKLKIQQKLLMRGGMMAAASLLYAALMDDDEAYQNAPPDQKYANWFVRVPGVDQPIRVPIPFEIGYIFKALPEALYNSMTSKQGGEDAVKAFKQILLQTIPGGSSYGIPQIMKPAIEAGLGKSFYTGRDILSAREKELLPEDQFRANTAEISKIVGKSLGISPIVMENLVRGYTGTMGLAFLHALSLGAPKSESPEAAVKRLSDYPIIGGAFQPNDAGGITNAVYERFNEDIKVRNSYKKMIEEGRSAEANELLQRRGNEIMEAEIADVFKQNMNKLTQAERAIAASTMTPEQKREQLDNIRKLKTAISRTMRETADKTVKLSSPL